MKYRLDKFMAINTFIAIADSSSFTAASKSLGISTATTTKTIARLEKQMAVRLLHRNTRKVSLTTEGREFYQHCTRILAELEEAEGAIHDGTLKPIGTIRVVASPSFGRLTLIPALPAFFERYPLVKIELDTRNEPIDVIGEGYDCWITGRTDVMASLLGLTMRSLGRNPLRIFGSTSYFAKRGIPKTPADLERHNCIALSWMGSRWQFKAEDGTAQAVAIDGNLKVRSGDALREAVRLGMGLAQASSGLFESDLEAGTIVSVLDDHVVGDRPISVLFPTTPHLPNKIRVFIDFLAEITRPKNAATP